MIEAIFAGWIACGVILVVAHHVFKKQQAKREAANVRFLAALQLEFERGGRLAESMAAVRDSAESAREGFQELLAERRTQLNDGEEQLARWEKVSDDLTAWAETYPSYLFAGADDERGQG